MKIDLDHVKEQINKAKPGADLKQLKSIKEILAKELEIAYEAIDKFE